MSSKFGDYYDHISDVVAIILMIGVLYYRYQFDKRWLIFDTEEFDLDADKIKCPRNALNPAGMIGRLTIKYPHSRIPNAGSTGKTESG